MTDIAIAGVVVAGISGIALLMLLGVLRAGRRERKKEDSDR